MKDIMKNISSILTKVIIIGVMLIAIILILRGGVPNGRQGLYDHAFVDSLEIVASMMPDTILVYDTIITREPVYINHPAPPSVPSTVDPGINLYRDSIINNEIRAWVDIEAHGTLKSINWKYQPVTHDVLKIVNVPYPVPYEKKVPLPRTGVYGSVGAGFGGNKAIFSAGVNYLSAKGRLFGVEVGHFQCNYIKLEYGLKF